MTKGRFLGIDYGEKRVGIAISDDGGTLAFPRDILLNRADIFKKLAGIIQTEDIAKIVVGESTDFSGKQNEVSVKIGKFISELENKFRLSVHRQKEFLTSVEARKSITGKKDLNFSQKHSKVKKTTASRVDASAAALILQRYLDRINKK